MEKIDIKVSGMVCGGCEKRVINALSLIDGIEEVTANHTDGLVSIKTSKKIEKNEIKETIEDLGFEIKD